MADEVHKIDVVLEAIDKASAPLKQITGGFNILTKQGLLAGASFAIVNKGLELVMDALNGFVEYLQKGIEMNRQFELEMVRLTNSFTSFANMGVDSLKDSVKSFSVMFATDINTVIQGLRDFTSEGYSASESISMLFKAQQLASATGENLGDVTNTITTALGVFGLSSKSTGNITEWLNKIMGITGMTAADINRILGGAADAINDTGISYAEMGDILVDLDEKEYSTKTMLTEIKTLLDDYPSSIDAVVGSFAELTGGVEDVGTKFEKITGTTQFTADMRKQLASISQMDLAGGMDVDKIFGEQRVKEAREYFNLINKDGITTLEQFNSEMGQTALKSKNPDFGWIGLDSQLVQLIRSMYAYNDAIEEQNRLTDEAKIEEQNTRVATLTQNLVDLDNSMIANISNIDQWNAEINKAKDIHLLNEDVRYMSMGLKDASYAMKIHNSETRNLVDSIRNYRDEIEELNRANQMLTIQENKNNIESMKIQLNAMDHRGRMTRNEKNKLKDIERANLELRINLAENQNEIDEKTLDLSPLEERFELMSMWYDEELYLIKNTYAEEVAALQKKIDDERALYNQSLRDKADYMLKLNSLTGTSNVPVIYGPPAPSSGRIPLSGTASSNNVNASIKVNATIHNYTDTEALVEKISQGIAGGLLGNVTSKYRIG